MLINSKLKCHVFTLAKMGEISEGKLRKGTSKGLHYKVNILVNFGDLS